MKLKNMGRAPQFVLLLSLLYLDNSYSVIMSCSLFKKNGKNILIISDWYSSKKKSLKSPKYLDSESDTETDSDLDFFDYSPKEKCSPNNENSTIFQWIERVKCNRICFLLGSALFEIKKWQHDNLMFSTKLRENLFHFAVKNKLRYNNIRFIFADVRTEKLKRLECLHKFKDTHFQTLAKEFEGNEEGHKASFKMLALEKCNENATILTRARLLKEINRLRDDLVQRIAQLSLIDRKFLSFKIEELDNLIAALKKFFEQDNFCQSDDCVIEMVAHAMIYKPQEIENFFKTIYLPLNALFAQIGFLVALSERQNTYDNVVLFVDSIYIKNIVKYLRNCEYLEKFSYGSVDLLQGVPLSEPAKPIFNPKDLEKLLNRAFDTVIRCAYCKKFEGDKRCTRCKKVFYCSAECQKADWATHKSKCVLRKHSTKK